ncbi:MAG: signal peptidase I [Oscillochloridaceae bacterium umkhey_bin13]
MPQPRRRRQHPLIAAFVMVTTVVSWVLFAPTALGGQASYVIINGNSMEPGMHRGDLAILRQREDYAVGAVVTYQHPSIGPVIHRIIERNSDRFVFQGDNNDFIDPYQPSGDELLGELWLFIPRAGTILSFLRQPPVFAVLAALLLGTTLMATSTLPTRPRRRPVARAAPPRTHERAALLNAALTVAMALGLVALGLAGLAFRQSTTRTITEAIPFEQQVRFRYHAPAPTGLYDHDQIQSGDPIFRRLNEQLAVSTTYTLSSQAPARLNGSAQLWVELSDGMGWRRTLALGPAQPFEGRNVTLEGTLDLAQISDLIRHYETQTGVRQNSYRLTLQPRYQLEGSLGEAALNTSFAPQLPFTLDETRLRPLSDQPASLLQFSETGSLNGNVTVPNTLSFWLITLDVVTARRMALIGLELALVGGLLAGWQLARTVRRDPLAGVRLRYRVQLVRTPTGATWMREAITLTSLDDLAQLAEQRGQPLIQVEHGPEAGIYLRDEAAVYAYRLPEAG